MNTALENSGVNARLRLVHTHKVAYNEPEVKTSTELGQLLERLRNPADGVMDEIHDLREQHMADLVSLMSGAFDWFRGYGRADLVVSPDDPGLWDKGFSVVGGHRYYQEGFAHEIGHNFGAGHSWFDDGPYGGSRPNYAHAYNDMDAPGKAFFTAVAYTSKCNATESFPCRVIPHYSKSWTRSGRVGRRV